MSILIAYFSHPGENYAAGDIVNLEVGNTEIAAKMIQKYTHADMFEIRKIDDYPFKYKETVEVAKEELFSDKRPPLAELLKNAENYDTLILAYPNWCSTMPMPVWTFLEKYPFAQKKIFPLCTNEGSKMGKSVDDIKRLTPKALVGKPLSITGCKVNKSEEIIRDWLKDILA